MSTTETGPQSHRRPGLRKPGGENEADPGDGERARSEGESGARHADPEHESPAEPPHAGTAVCSIASPITSIPVRPVARASGATMTRCESTAVATACTSSGNT